MKAGITIIVEIEDEKSFFFEKLENADYSDIEDLLNEASIRAEEYISRKRIDEANNEDE
jgi:hypothetical protein